jgi:H+-transporting ATPase
VTKLDSIEDAASIDIFCFDKTGTLTQNRLTVIESVATGNVESKDVITWAASASKSESMDAIDLAILEFSVTSHADLHDFNQKTYTPFDPANKRTEATVESAGKTFLVIKGAAQTVLSLCVNIDDSEMDFLNKTISRFSQKGYRTIAVARTEKEKPADMRIVGLLALADPIREDSAEMIDQMKRLGIKPILLTGDSIAIAQEISTQAGIGPKIARIADLDKLDVKDQLSFIRNNDGFAEVYPEDKYRIVKLLQNNGHLVGMTGDGVNDSPALKQAELGVAVSGATDVARASASIVLTQPGLGEVVDAIKISRQTYQRMLTWVINKIVKVFEIVILFTVGFFLFHNMVITLLGMSLLVFANDFVTISIATDHVKSTDSPNQWNIKNITFSAAFIGLFFALEDLFIIYAGTTWFHLGLDGIQTLVLLSLVFNSQFRILIVRERKHFWSSFPNKNMLLVNISTVIGFTLLGVFGFIIPAVPFLQIVILIGIALVSLLGIDFLKYFIFHKLIK